MLNLLHKKLFQFGFFAVIFMVFLLAAMYTQIYYLIAIPFFVLFFFAGWLHWKTIFFLLLVSLPFSFEYQFLPEWGTDIPDELLMLLVAAFSVAYLVYLPKTISRQTWQHLILLILGLYFCWILITALFSTHLLVSVKYVLAKGWYAGAFVLAPLLVLQNRKRLEMAGKILAASMFGVTIIILWRHSQTGFHFAGINDAVAPFFRNHVTYSAMLVCMIPVFIAIHRLSKPGKKRIFISFAIALLLVALFFSYARGAWLALVLGLLTYGLIRKKLLFLSYIMTIIITAASLCWLINNNRYLRFAHDHNTTIFHNNFGEHLIATYQLKDVSTAERFYRWIAGVRMIKDNPLTGYGPNTFYEHYKGYAVPAFETWVSDNADHSTVHNYFLLIAIEQGIPGLLFFLLLLGAMIYYAQYLYHRTADLFYKTVTITIGVMLTMLIVVNFLSDLIETDKVGSLFFLCLACLIVTDVNTRKAIEEV